MVSMTYFLRDQQWGLKAVNRGEGALLRGDHSFGRKSRTLRVEPSQLPYIRRTTATHVIITADQFSRMLIVSRGHCNRAFASLVVI